MPDSPIFIATRGSALALAQANMILHECRTTFPQQPFELKIIKTTGDKMQTASMARIDATLPRGLFTKELEIALLNGEADLAVHSLKDLPTELPPGLKLGAVTEREDVRDVLIYRSADYLKRNALADRRGFKSHLGIKELSQHATVATSSTRRKAQLLSIRPDLMVVEIRGNVATRLEKLSRNPDLDATILAAAGLKRLKFQISSSGELTGEGVPEGLLASPVSLEEMLPCVGQAAIGIEIRENDQRIDGICRGLNDTNTFHCVTAERAFLRALGGGCQSAVAAYAQILQDQLELKAISFLGDKPQRAHARKPLSDASILGENLAKEFRK